MAKKNLKVEMIEFLLLVYCIKNYFTPLDTGERFKNLKLNGEILLSYSS